ncbi:hypothetical protein GRZ55_05370 [Chelativorans sp. ZYF759]|uniref:hypothetical protein n=1 Tax=Chelativorans sp. ZYF759 TaxID=2692213 RepID=UPI00145CF3B9|nr:hypothetical protein [Chelativorans sp. ZYF759]NMG38671.1 hypothetical protein [Chelativorans sp. ZYF759]
MSDDPNTAGQDRPDGDKAMDDELAMRLAEETDLSPNQAKRLIEKHGRDYEKLRELAATFKAEG